MNEDPQSIVTEINGCISTAAKRQHGLIKLAFFLENCSSSEEFCLLEQNSSFWIKTLFQIFENYPVSIHAKLAHYCFYLIIQNSKSISAELSRTISTNYIEKSITLLTSSSEQLSKSALICLNELITCYRAACSQHKTKIETFVVNKLESENPEVVEWASKCYSTLAFLHKTQNNVDMWYVYFKAMLKSANTILNEIFDETSSDEKESEETSNKSNISLKLFPKLSKDADNMEDFYAKNSKRFRACCQSLGYLLHPLNNHVVIHMRPVEVINFMKRLFIFDFKKLRVNVEARYLTPILPGIFNDLFKFSRKFFSTLNTNLIINSNAISHMLSHFAPVLKEKLMSPCVSGFYDLVSEWLQATGACSGLLKYATNLIDSIIDEIKPAKKNILCIDNSLSKGGKGRATSTVSDASINNHQTKERNKVAISTLRCLNSLVKYFGTKFSYSHLEKTQQTIVNVILSVQHNSTTQKPYNHFECRLELYHTLFDLCLLDGGKLAPPIAVAISIFQNALEDQSQEIKLFAQQSLNTLKAFTYPILPIYIREYTHSQKQEDNTASHDLISKAILNITQSQLTTGLNTSKQVLNGGDAHSKMNGDTQFFTLDQMKTSLKRKQETIEDDLNPHPLQQQQQQQQQVNKVKEVEVNFEEKKLNGNTTTTTTTITTTNHILKKFRSEKEMKESNEVEEVVIDNGSDDDDDEMAEDEEEEEEDEEEIDDEEELDEEEDIDEEIEEDECEEDAVYLDEVEEVEEENSKMKNGDEEDKTKIRKLLEEDGDYDDDEDEEVVGGDDEVVDEEESKKEEIEMPNEATLEQEVVEEQVVTNTMSEAAKDEGEEIVEDEEVVVRTESATNIYENEVETIAKPGEYDPTDYEFSLSRPALVQTPVIVESANVSQTQSTDEKCEIELKQDVQIESNNANDANQEQQTVVEIEIENHSSSSNNNNNNSSEDQENQNQNAELLKSEQEEAKLKEMCATLNVDAVLESIDANK